MTRFFFLGLFLLGGCEVQALDYSSWEFLDSQQRIRTAEDVEEVRAEMVELVFGGGMPTRYPDDVEFVLDPAFRAHLVQKITVETDDLTSFPYLIHPSSWNGALAIYHQGHAGDFRDYGADTIHGLLDAGYQVLAFSMPMKGMNSHPFESDEHWMLGDRPHPLRYFADPVIVALNWADATFAYSRRIMVGLSGGGWTTVVVSGIDERIDASYPVAGSWPHYLRDRFGYFGCYEERITPSYLELYLMATYPGREQAQFFNEFDSCCFGGLYAYDYLSYVSYLANEWEGRFQIVLDHGEFEHVISRYTLEEILEIERAGR